MSDIDNTAALYDFVTKQKHSVEEKNLAKIRELQRRERKEKLYSFSPIEVCKRP